MMHPEIGKSIQSESRLVVAKSWGSGRLMAKRYGVSFLGDESALKSTVVMIV